MRRFYYDFLIDKQPILAPDADLQIEYTDLDSESSGRDECGWSVGVFQYVGKCADQIKGQ